MAPSSSPSRQNQNQNRQSPAVKPHSASSTNHNQFIKDPVAHFKAMPWANALLSDPSVVQIIVVDRRPLPSGESNFVRKVMNTGTTVRACVTFFRTIKTTSSASSSSSSSASSSPVAKTPASSLPSPSQHQQPPRRQQQQQQEEEEEKEEGKEKEDEGEEEEEKEKKNKEEKNNIPITKCEAILQGGGPDDEEDPRNPFLLLGALVDLGEDLAGFAGTMHGGLFAVLMDEVMGTAANLQARQHGAYTVSFTTRYRQPVRVPQVVLVRGRVVRRQGRKIFARGCIEDKEGNVMAEGEGVWVQMDKNVGRSRL